MDDAGRRNGCTGRTAGGDRRVIQRIARPMIGLAPVEHDTGALRHGAKGRREARNVDAPLVALLANRHKARPDMVVDPDQREAAARSAFVLWCGPLPT